MKLPKTFTTVTLIDPHNSSVPWTGSALIMFSRRDKDKEVDIQHKALTSYPALSQGSQPWEHMDIDDTELHF